jgi:hypothetical protein
MIQDPYSQFGSGYGDLSLPSQQLPGFSPQAQTGGIISGAANATAPSMNREQWRDAWMGLGQMTPQQSEEWLRNNGAQRITESGVWQTPHGEQLDLEIGRKAALAGMNGGMITPGWTSIANPTNPGGQQVNGQGPFGGFLSQLFSSLGGQNQNQGAQPYNQYAGKQQSTSNLFGGMQPTGQSDGTLLGTSFSRQSSDPSAQAANPAPEGNTANWTRQAPKKSWDMFSSSTSSESNNNQPMGAPSYYGKSEGYLPANNMGVQR